MNPDNMVQSTGEWLRGNGPESDVVVSTRIRLARNHAAFPFTSRASPQQKTEIEQLVRERLARIERDPPLQYLNVAKMGQLDRQFLVERQLISRELASAEGPRAVAVDTRESVSLMINEEDHLRIQVMQSGLNLEDAFQLANRIDDELAKKLDFGYSMHWGYLTACPTNTGTGMRGSVMLHLPALVMTKQINKVLTAVNKLSFTSRGFYGEGTQASGNFYQISNQVSMGQSETDILQNISGLIRQIIEQEEQARQALLVQNRPMLQDKIYRSYGILKNSYLISSQETVELLSMVRLGIDLGIVTDVDRRLINDLFIRIQPAHLQKIEGKKLNASERDAKRAAVIREKLNPKGSG